MKTTHYFPHDTNARNDTKLQKLFMQEGLKGLGLFWCIVEMIYENNGRLLIDEIPTYAFTLHCEPNEIMALITKYKLFKRDKKWFFSVTAIDRLNEIKQRSESAKIGALKRWGNANAMQTQNDGNAINKSKVNKIKGKYGL